MLGYGQAFYQRFLKKSVEGFHKNLRISHLWLFRTNDQEFGMLQSKVDHSMFYKHSHNGKIRVAHS